MEYFAQTYDNWTLSETFTLLPAFALFNHDSHSSLSLLGPYCLISLFSVTIERAVSGGFLLNMLLITVFLLMEV